MEKNITINPTGNITPEKKLTQTNPSKKAAIQSILEKYNLKTPKKSKTNAVPVEYEIKPKDASQIIHISKSAPSTPNLPSIPTSEKQVKKEPRDIRETISAPTSPPTSPHTQLHTKSRDIERSGGGAIVPAQLPVAGDNSSIL